MDEHDPYLDATPYESQTSGLAITSLVLAVLGFSTCGTTSRPGVICGHLARSQIAEKEQQGTPQGGAYYALAGLILSYINLGLACVTGILVALYFSAIIAILGAGAY